MTVRISGDKFLVCGSHQSSGNSDPDQDPLGIFPCRQCPNETHQGPAQKIENEAGNAAKAFIELVSHCAISSRINNLDHLSVIMRP